MIADQVRVNSYSQALRDLVSSTSVVLDIGSGPGIFALLACQLGARRVYAVEPDNSIQLARELARANGFADRIQFIQGLSNKITLPENADIIVSDIRGVLPYFQRHIPTIVDARKRLLSLNGKLIPQSDRLWAAIVQAPEVYADHMTAWDNDLYGLNLEAGRSLAANTFRKFRIKPEQLLLAGQCWASIDYAQVENPDVCSEIAWTVDNDGTGHGIAAWVDATLAKGVSFSNAPGETETIYSNAFFPWLKPVALSVGDTLSVTLRADLIGDDYVWRWNTKVLDQGRSDIVKADFKQSTLFGVPLTPARLRQRSSDHVPKLDVDGEIDLLILQQINGSATTEQISKRVFDLFPSRFTNFTDALSRVTELAVKYGNEPE